MEENMIDQRFQEDFINEIIIEGTSIETDESDFGQHEVEIINEHLQHQDSLAYTLLQSDFLMDSQGFHENEGSVSSPAVETIDDMLTVTYDKDDIVHTDLGVVGELSHDESSQDIKQNTSISNGMDPHYSASVVAGNLNEVIDVHIDTEHNVDQRETVDKVSECMNENIRDKQSEENASHICDICGKAFGRKSYLTRHKRLHAENKKFTCDICQRGFISNAMFARHKLTHTEQRPFVCDICGCSFRARSGLTYHLRSHSDNRESHQCLMCAKKFSLKSSLSQHIRIVHHKERPYLCDTCGGSFQKLSALKKHSMRHVPEHLVDYSFICEICKKAFKDKNTLKFHLKLHDSIKQFVCTQCDKSFTYKHALNSHLRTHTGARPYICAHCGKSFTQSSSLKGHMHRHENE